VTAHRRRQETKKSPAIPMRTEGSIAAGPFASLMLLDDAPSPASRRLASGPAALGTRPTVILGQAPRCPLTEPELYGIFQEADRLDRD